MNESQSIAADKANERLDTFLARHFPERSRSFWQKYCDEDKIIVNDKPRQANYRLMHEAIVHIPSMVQPELTQQAIPIIYEDDDVLVVNKPSGMLTHAKGALSDEFTIADFVRPRTTDGVETNRPGIVHRLDRDTSGVLIAAKTTEAKHWLQKQFAERKVKKAYIALVQGHLKEPRALINLPIERNPRKPQTFRVSGKGKSAETDYETLQVLPAYTLLKLRPHTGRTHQLRVHMAYLNHPIVSDPWYGTLDKKLNRLFLHAAELELTLPSHVRKVFHAPLPPELEQYLKSVQ